MKSEAAGELTPALLEETVGGNLERTVAAIRARRRSSSVPLDGAGPMPSSTLTSLRWPVA